MSVPLALARLYAHLVFRRPPTDWSVPAADGRYEPADPAGPAEPTGPDDDRPLTLLVLGDSLAQSLAEGVGRPVLLRVHARAGATTAAVGRQVARSARLRPGIAVLIVGGNDVLLPAPLGRAARRFAHLARALRDAGWQLVVVPCPNPGYGPGFRRLARWIGHYRSRRLARLHTRTAVRTGAHLAPTAGPEFRERADTLLGPDGVHPSPAGYAAHAARMLPTILEAAVQVRTPVPAPN
ncbi:GDSL-type esterase/lipase family protein [Kitasatospora sp. NPDC093558]|uniref:GDSL-type esterase/lipase family protein n=1 Tax=Kitasatospora sp. NPDC093558 TaxID=3155201 RepID=UPI00341B8E7A